jgi:hypothetical protein
MLLDLLLHKIIFHGDLKQVLNYYHLLPIPKIYKMIVKIFQKKNNLFTVLLAILLKCYS